MAHAAEAPQEAANLPQRSDWNPHKNVFPGFSMHGTGLDFGEVGADSGEFRERGDQRAGTIFDREATLILLDSGSHRRPWCDGQEEAGKVFRIVLNAA